MSENQLDVYRSTYTAGQAAKVAGIPYHHVNYWANTNFITPSVARQAAP